MEKPWSWVRAPKTPFSPRKKIVGASTPGIAAPGTRSSSFVARDISARIVARFERQVGRATAVSITRPSAGGAGRGR